MRQTGTVPGAPQRARRRRPRGIGADRHRPHPTDTQVQAIQDRLNRRPRIVLNGQTPTEKLNDIITGANTT